MKDSYERFLSRFNISKDEFYKYGLEETIFPSFDKAEAMWSRLKEKIRNNEEVHIRGYGRDGKGTALFVDFYRRATGNTNIQRDSTNNAAPKKVIVESTGLTRKDIDNEVSLRNYQISHVFGRTKNIYAFTAPWNIVYIPKMMDPLTGHEAKGLIVQEYTRLFQEETFRRYATLIADFNRIITAPAFTGRLAGAINEMRAIGQYEVGDIAKLVRSVDAEFRPIEILQ